MAFDMNSIGALSSLLEDSRKEETMRERQSQPPMATSVTKVVTGHRSHENEKKSEQKKPSSNIWDMDSISTEDSLLALNRDDRPCPRYEICYKQAVGTEDTFLGLSDKSPSSEDCTHLIVKIHFPGCKMKDLNLDVCKNCLSAESKSFRLFTYLPKNVDFDNGNAKFDSKKEVLTITLPIVEE